ncbi:MAG: precorrin-6Y C5,15-methyltransferase (decarboxylating) subunit CbiT [Candidatus Hydrothermarchaeales archaeon]
MKWDYRTPGIPDKLFIKGKTPMTKEEIRVITLSKANIREDNVIYDIGAGTGSISIEAAILAQKGKVFSIEKEQERANIIKENIKKFEVKNVEVIEGKAPLALENLPTADRIVIGGSGGKVKEILSSCHEKLNENGVIVVNAVTLNTLHEAVTTMEDLGFTIDITQVAVTKVEDFAKTRVMRGMNPVFVIRGTKRR